MERRQRIPSIYFTQPPHPAPQHPRHPAHSVLRAQMPVLKTAEDNQRLCDFISPLRASGNWHWLEVYRVETDQGSWAWGHQGGIREGGGPAARHA